jgi:hypothetical protein
VLLVLDSSNLLAVLLLLSLPLLLVTAVVALYLRYLFSLSRVQDVLDRYEEICSELAGWPIQPEYGSFQDEAGTHYYYSVKDPSSEEDWIHPSELEEG